MGEEFGQLQSFGVLDIIANGKAPNLEIDDFENVAFVAEGRQARISECGAGGTGAGEQVGVDGEAETVALPLIEKEFVGCDFVSVAFESRDVELAPSDGDFVPQAKLYV